MNSKIRTNQDIYINIDAFNLLIVAYYERMQLYYEFLCNRSTFEIEKSDSFSKVSFSLRAIKSKSNLKFSSNSLIEF